MAKKYIPVTSFEEALAADAAGVLYIANFSKANIAAGDSPGPDYRVSSEQWCAEPGWGRDGSSFRLWEHNFPGNGGENWDMEDFVILTDDDDEE